MNFIASIAIVATGPLRAARGDDARGDVHLGQHPSTEDVAVGVDVGWPRHHAQDRLAHKIGHSLLLVVNARRRPPRHGRSALRNTSVISDVPSSTVNPTPSAVAMIRLA